jgi:hypothetical protein
MKLGEFNEKHLPPFRKFFSLLVEHLNRAQQALCKAMGAADLLSFQKLFYLAVHFGWYIFAKLTGGSCVFGVRTGREMEGKRKSRQRELQ